MIRNVLSRFRKWVVGIFTGRGTSRSRASGGWLADLDRANAEASEGPRKRAGKNAFFTQPQWRRRKSRMHMARASRRGNR